MKEQNKGRILIILSALLWGLAGVCVKSIPWNPFSIMAVRSTISFLIILISRRSLKVKLTKKTFFGSVLQVATGILYMAAIKLTTAATAIVLQYVAPILVFLFTIIVQKKRPKWTQTLIVLAVFGGIVLSFADELDPRYVIGNLLGLLSGVSFAGQIILFSDPEVDSGGAMMLSNLIGMLICYPLMAFDKHLDFSPNTIMWVLILGIFQYGLANLCYTKGCQKISELETSLLLTIEPIFNPIPVLIVTGEMPGTLAWIGFALVIAGVTMYALLPTLEKRVRRRREQT